MLPHNHKTWGGKMSCFPSEEMWKKTHHEIHDLMIRLSSLKPSNIYDKRRIMKIMEILFDLDDKLHEHGKNGRICWDVFRKRIEVVKKEIEKMSVR